MILKVLGWAVGLLIVAGGALWLFGPRESVVTSVAFDETRLAGGVGNYLAQAEAGFDDLTEGTQKRVVWAGSPEQRTSLSILYVHGFSASSEEIRPLPDRVAQALGANLVFTRLQGHGRPGAALAEATVEGWMSEMAEALAVARAVGERVVVISTSTGGTLTALALHESMGQGVAGAVFVSPNFRVNDPAAALLTWPAARWWLPKLAGAERVFEPRNAAQGMFWTSAYPTTALLPMGATVKAARALDHGRIAVPALWVFDDADRVVDHAVTREVAAAWGGPSQLHVVKVGPDDDSHAHVIAGDIMSPSMTQALSGTIADWIAALQ
ncbi:alpha/beta hydrolase [Thalassococcus sp. CAU 1522]|uniref:Alpha/beta hydrolase n=1 Tax=Thalassococcus arenae TaxID=2851652 RepID=A0ABS6N2T4_9RHOB|nr:alpha/beta hydrolase [Thalassococcus arenae]MBV2358326.1 alpha/beta hydrolase [Thalassococcus arenae]